MTSTTERKRITSLDQLIPAKTPVQTSCGELYVRFLRTSEFLQLVEADLGRSLLQRVCGHVQDKQDRSGLSDQTVDALSPTDIALLVQAFAKQSRWEECPEITDFDAFGQEFLQQLDRENKSRQESLREALKQSKETSDYKVLDVPEPFIPPRPEDTPLGQALLTSAERLEVISQVALNAEQRSAQSDQTAKTSLCIAIAALVVSSVSMIATIWPLVSPKGSVEESSKAAPAQQVQQDQELQAKPALPQESERSVKNH